jgi:hypothetical protein
MQAVGRSPLHRRHVRSGSQRDQGSRLDHGLLGLPADDESLDGSHLSVIPLEGDRHPIRRDADVGWRPARRTTDLPDSSLHVRHRHVYAAHAHVGAYGAEVVTEVQEFDDQGWFAFRDRDGNLFMVCGTSPQRGEPEL